jgi:hypothetical protein
MKPANARAGVATAAFIAVLSFCFARPAAAQDPGGGLSSPEISRCAGKFGAILRGADQAFPVFSLDGVPWINIKSSDKTVAGGARIATTVTGTGSRQRRRGQVVMFRFTCLLDDAGEAVVFNWSDLLPERHEALPPAIVVRGMASYQTKMSLPRGAELRVQLLDIATNPAGEILGEVAVRSGWEQAIPFALRVPMETKLEGRKLVVVSRLVLGGSDLYKPKIPLAVSADDLRRPLALVLEPVVGQSP